MSVEGVDSLATSHNALICIGRDSSFEIAVWSVCDVCTAGTKEVWLEVECTVVSSVSRVDGPVASLGDDLIVRCVTCVGVDGMTLAVVNAALCVPWVSRVVVCCDVLEVVVSDVVSGLSHGPSGTELNLTLAKRSSYCVGCTGLVSCSLSSLSGGAYSVVGEVERVWSGVVGSDRVVLYLWVGWSLRTETVWCGYHDLKLFVSDLLLRVKFRRALLLLLLLWLVRSAVVLLAVIVCLMRIVLLGDCLRPCWDLTTLVVLMYR